MDAADPITLLELLLDPCLTVDEARREAAARGITPDAKRSASDATDATALVSP